MGGLITKKMLTALNTPSESERLQHVHSTVFIAVPSGGADSASITAWLSSNPQFKNMDSRDAEALLQTIEGEWASLYRARDNHHPFPRSFVAYETRDVIALKIVPALFTSSVSDLPPVAFDYDHIRIVKPDSPGNEVYKWTKRRIIESSNYQVGGFGGLSHTCRFDQGPKAGQTQTFPNAPPSVVGSNCQDGVSSGIAVPDSAAHQQDSKVQQTSTGAGSPNVQGVQGDVTITVDQSTDKTKTETTKPAEKKPKQENQ
jgi:hypothetical protein